MALNNITGYEFNNGNIQTTANGESGEVDGIEILVNLAKQGKIDPWNIDIISVYDNYMTQVFKAKGQNLQITGRTLLFAAILLKLKSNILAGIDIVDFQPQHDDELEEYDDSELEYREDDLPTNNVISIDEVLQRRTSVRLNHNRTVTLRDLIRQLEFYEMLDKKQRLKNAQARAIRRVQSYAKLTAEDIVNLAHDEEYIKNGVMKLHANLDEILNRQERIELNELTLLGMDRMSAYVSLLFLTAESNYELYQKDFYSDLYVVKSEPVSGIEEDNILDAVENAKGVVSEEADGTVKVQN